MPSDPNRAHRNSDLSRPHTYGLPRLPREYYQGDAVVHWTLPVFDRVTGWLSPPFQQRFRELMLHAAAREGLFCPVYCLMPDHLHLIWMGLRIDTDQLNGMSFLRTYLEPALAPAKFQPQAHDRVLRAEQRKRNAFAETCRYDLNNPVRAGLAQRPEDWQFNGAVIPGYPTLHPLQTDYWEKFLGLLAKARHRTRGTLSDRHSTCCPTPRGAKREVYCRRRRKESLI